MRESTPDSTPRTPPAWAAAAVPASAYDEIASALTNPDSPVGIDAKHTHVLILHALDRIERKLDDAAVGEGTPTPPAATGVTDANAVSTRAHELLRRSRAAGAIEPALRNRLEAAITRTVRVAAGGEAEGLPGFVADLLGGVFEAIVDASVQQMEAYADLLEGVAEAGDGVADGSRRSRLATQRQRLLATMVLMGVNRVVVTRGRIRVRSVFEDDGDDDD